MAPSWVKAKPWAWTLSVSPFAPSVRGSVMENDRVASGSVTSPFPTVTSRSEKVVVSARRSSAMSAAFSAEPLGAAAWASERFRERAAGGPDGTG